MKRIYFFITSLPFMAFLFLSLAFSMAIATFIESSYGTPAARALVYNTHWFELLWALLALNLLNNLIKYKFFTRHRISLGLFHISFLFMLLGAAITRYFSYEGVMHIRENQSTNSILSTDDYFFAGFGGQEKERKVRFSELSPRQFSTRFNVDGNKVTVKSVGFIENAERKPIPSETGDPAIDFVFSSPNRQGMQSHTFFKGDLLDQHGFSVGFESATATSIRFFMQGVNLFMTSETPVEETTMTSGNHVYINPGDTISIKNMSLYSVGNYRFLIRNFFPGASVTAVKSQSVTNEDAVLIQISDGLQKQTIPVFGHSGVAPDTVTVPLGNGRLKLAYGAMPLRVPFRIFLKNFQLDRYPGSQSPSSFASDVILIDKKAGIEKNAQIFMNNTLTYKNYKFFQSSYDMDEQGTVLSVNHDFWGTSITYLGYALLVIGIILSLMNKNSYFQFLTHKLKQSSVKAVAATILFSSVSLGSQAQTGAGIPDIDNQIVKEFSELWVQGVDGRVEPVSTLSSEIIRKVSRKSALYGKSPDEVVLSMMAYPEVWRTMPIIKVSNKTLATQIGANGKYISIRQLFNAQGNYKIAKNVRAANNKTPALRNRVEKEYIYVDERVNILFMVFRGSLLHLYPRPAKEANWYTPGAVANEYSGGDSIFIKSGFQLLLQSLTEKREAETHQVLQTIARFQQKYGGNLLPSQSKKRVEILYNKINPFKRIFPFYLLFGFLLLFVLFVNIFRQKSLPGFLRISFLGLIFIAFLIHTAGLILRWYISGHAPWSNGYESIVYVAWAAMFAGFVFGRKYPMVVGTAAFLSGIALFVAHLSWMNPEVTNLVPVLKSYWLTIHVAVITASYGFIGLSAFIGILVMILIVLRNSSNEEKVSGFIEQLTTINEMAAIIGLYFLTIGTFFGAIWANESWGSYWSWDPKETWSLITIVIYSFIVHMRLIPSLKGVYTFNLASVLGFASVLMTYFGVNYYLSGLHSYGKGVADGVSPAVPVAFIILGALMVWAYVKDSRFEKAKVTE